MAHIYFPIHFGILYLLDAIYEDVIYDAYILWIVNLKFSGTFRLKILIGWLYLILFWVLDHSVIM